MIDLAASTAPARLGEPARDRGSGRLFTGEWDGRPVLVRRLPGSPDHGIRARVELLAAALVGLHGPGLVPVLAVASDWQALDLIQESPSVLGSLATWTRERPLRNGEVVGVGLRLAAALAQLHAVGLTHGRLHAGDVLVATDGDVLLTGYGVAGILGSAGSPTEDVRDLAALLLLLCPEDDSSSLRRRLHDVLSTDGDALEGLFDAMEHCGLRGEALRVAGSRLPVPRPATERRGAGLSAVGRWLLPPGTPWRVFGRLLPAALGIVILAGWLGSRAAPEASPAAEPAPATSSVPKLSEPTTAAPVTSRPDVPPPPDWRAVVEDLNARRAALLAHPDLARLADVDAPGSTAFASDAALVRALRMRRAAARGAETTLASLRVRSAGPVRTDVEVVDRLAPHTIVSAEGQVIERRPGRGARTTVLVLVNGDAGWRVAQVLPA